MFIYDADPAVAEASAQALGRASTDLAGKAADTGVGCAGCGGQALYRDVAGATNRGDGVQRGREYFPEMLAEIAGASLRALRVEIIGHAGEMGRGGQPAVQLVDEADPALAAVSAELFAVGSVVVAGRFGKDDQCDCDRAGAEGGGGDRTGAVRRRDRRSKNDGRRVVRSEGLSCFVKISFTM